MLFTRKPSGDLAALIGTLRYVRDAKADDAVAGFFLPETLQLLAALLAVREDELQAVAEQRDRAIGLCKGLRIHVATLQLALKGSMPPAQRRKDVARLVRRLERDAASIAVRGEPMRAAS